MNRVLSSLMAALVTATPMAAPVPTHPEVPGKSAPKVSKSKRSSAKRSHSEPRPYQIGVASWYGKQFHGRTTANGEDFDMFELTAAHRQLPLGTWVKVTNLRNGKWIIVRINDRGPYVSGRIMYLSYGASRLLNFSSGLEGAPSDVSSPQTVAAAQTY